jgi:PPK2 family polyphosphate:nucleotide phosphotransferase
MARRTSTSLAAPFTIVSGRRFRLEDFDPGSTDGVKNKAEGLALLEQRAAEIGELQETLYAVDQWSTLLVFQAMDAAGKDGAIKHVMSGVNPAGVQVFSFKAPSSEELDHDFMWRTTRCLPERGRIGIFNRSYYEEVLVVRVHPELLSGQRLPEAALSKDIWKTRFEAINASERHLARNGYVIRKFFLHVSKAEQKRRFLARLDAPAKNWKFSIRDVAERGRWNDYMAAYEDMIRHTATKDAPWVVVPADHKWYARLIVATATADALRARKLKFPVTTPERARELAEARARLLKERG